VLLCISLYTAAEVDVDQLPITLSQASGVPFYRQIVDQTADLIRSGQLVPGAQLPSVRELAGQLLVSLITVRRAYSDLENARLIVLRQGYGTYVADDVVAASRGQALAEARAALGAAIARARRIGVDVATIRTMLEELLAGHEVDDVRG
jgi:GntR family transcriptional regulator